MNRAQLKMAIMAWLHRASLRTPVADPFDAVTGFIALAEQDLNEKLRAFCMVVRATQAIDGQYTTAPCDMLEPLDFRIAGGGPPIIYESRNQTAAAFYNHTMNTPLGSSLAGMGPDFIGNLPPAGYAWDNGIPTRFTMVGSEIEWSPFPQPELPVPPGYQWPVVEMAYYTRLNLGLEDTDTNAVLSMYPGVYIYGSLVHAAPFLRDDSRVQTWGGLVQNLIDGANREHERRRHAGSPLKQTYRRLA